MVDDEMDDDVAHLT